MLTISKKEMINPIFTIDDLEEGDLFLYNNCVYMKIEEVIDTYGEHFNAISLDKSYHIGACFDIDKNDATIPLDGELLIERRNFLG